jgi:glutamate racemase
MTYNDNIGCTHYYFITTQNSIREAVDQLTKKFKYVEEVTDSFKGVVNYMRKENSKHEFECEDEDVELIR